VSSSRRAAIGAIGARAVSILASFALTFVVARVLAVDDAGTFFLVFTSIAVVATFGRFGTDNLALKVVGAADSNVRTDVRRLLAIAVCASLIGVALGVALTGVVGIDLPGPVGVALLVASAILPQALAVLAGALLRARGRLILGTFAELGSMPALTTVAIGVVVVVVGGATLERALLCLVVGSWLTAVWSVVAAAFALRGVVPEKHVPRARLGEFLSRYVRQLVAMMGTSLIFYVITWIPIYVLSAVGEIEAVSYYTAAARLAGFIGLIPAIQVSYLAPTFARLHQQSDVTALNRLAGRSALTALALAAGPALVLAALSGPILRLLYGAPYDDGWYVLSLLTLGVIFSVAAGQVNQLMLLCDLEQVALWLNVGLLVAWIAIGIVAAQQYGLLGVAVVSVALTVVYQLVAVVALRRSASIRSYARLARNS
jgi:O-antigen/teichoic acid export membrane protein